MELHQDQDQPTLLNTSPEEVAPAIMDQPAPSGSGPDIATLIQQDIEARAVTGEQKYGERLMPHNGRDAQIDKYQEMLDMVMYERQRLEEKAKTIQVWKWEDAPQAFRKLSQHGGDEDWVAFVPQALKDETIWWMEEGTPFGVCDVYSYPVEGGIIRIGAHA